MTIRPMRRDDSAWILVLSAHNEIETSPLDAGKLEAMRTQAWRAFVVDPEQAYLIAFDPNADYASPNYHWFRERYVRFAYVDRIVVSGAARGAGLARMLYERVIDDARAANLGVLCAEVNFAPPNPGSDALHARFGFTEVGRAQLESGKGVRYLARDLSDVT